MGEGVDPADGSTEAHYESTQHCTEQGMQTAPVEVQYGVFGSVDFDHWGGLHLRLRHWHLLLFL